MLTIIVSTLLISLIANIVLKKFDLPTIIGYILTGTTIAYLFGLHEAVNNHTLKEIAEFGIAFLMFTIGLEFSIRHLKSMKYEVFFIGSLQIVSTAIVGYLIAFYLFGFNETTALVLGLVIAMSSTAIVLKTFNETGEVNKKYGKNALGILIMQDIAVIPVLILIGILGSQESNVSAILLQTFISAIVLLVILFLVGKYLLEPFFTQIIKSDSDELFMGSILFLAIGTSYLAHLLGFSYSLGAFVAGMLISETKYKHQAEAELIPFRDLLLGVFFITVGMQIKFDIVFDYLHIIGLVLVGIMLIKFFLLYLIVKIRNDKVNTFKTALSLIQVGEFSLVILELARVNALIASPYAQIMIVTIVISMMITPLILKYLTPITDFVLKEEEHESEALFLTEPISNHVVVLGYGEFGQNITSKLKNDGEFYIIIENNIDKYHHAKENHEAVLFGNAEKRTLLHKAYVRRAKKIIVAIDNPKKRYQLCEELQKTVPSDKIIVKVHAIREKKPLYELGLRHIIVENEETSRAILEYI